MHKNDYDDDASIKEDVNNIYADVKYHDKLCETFTLL